MAVLCAAVVGACGDDATATVAAGDVVFGEGEIPATVPSDFPVPAAGVIGTTVIDRINHKTEFNVQIPVDLISAVQFFELELVSRGYVVTRSEALSEQNWRIAFRQGELIGEVVVNTLGDEVSQAVVTLNVA